MREFVDHLKSVLDVNDDSPFFGDGICKKRTS